MTIKQSEMNKTIIAEGIMYEIPNDMKTALKTNADVLERWNKLTPIQRNEWICWTTIVKKAETRAEHIQHITEDIKEGKKTTLLLARMPA